MKNFAYAVLLISTFCSYGMPTAAGVLSIDTPGAFDSAVNEGDTSRALQSLLEQRWNLTEPEFLYGGLEFTLDYTMSDYIQDQFVDYALYDGAECKQGANDITENIYLGSQVTPDGTPVGDGTGEREMTLTLTINPNTISSSAVYNTDDQDNASVFFCVRFSLYNGDAESADAIETNFIETLITLNVDLTDNFNIEDVNVEPKEKEEESANQVYEVEAYECDADNEEIVSDAPRAQGSAIRICVTPTQEALDAGVFMRRINFFDFNRGDVTQPAIEPDGQEASSGLTILVCGEGSAICSFETLLQADFFFSAGTVNGSGEALMQFGDGSINDQSRRQLRARIVSRAMREDTGVAGASEFNMNFEVEGPVNEESAGSGDSGSCLAIVVGGVVAAAVFVFLCLLVVLARRRRSGNRKTVEDSRVVHSTASGKPVDGKDQSAPPSAV